MLAFDEYSNLQMKYEQQLELNQVAEEFAHQVRIYIRTYELFVAVMSLLRSLCCVCNVCFIGLAA